MIKFFRKIRKTLLEQSKMGKYFKYAIGEIILVMIGILLALQVNNWNEKRNAKIEETKILSSLLEDIKTAKINCQAQLDTELKNIKTYEKVLGNNASKQSILNHPKVDSLFFRILWGVGENSTVISAITEVQNSGNISKIGNKEIRKQIAALDAQLNSVVVTIRDRLDVHQLSIDQFSFDIANFRKLATAVSPKKYDINYGPENDYKSLFNNKKFLNAISIKLDLSDSVIDDRILLMKEIEKLIELIQKELKGKSK